MKCNYIRRQNYMISESKNLELYARKERKNGERVEAEKGFRYLSSQIMTGGQRIAQVKQSFNQTIKE